MIDSAIDDLCHAIRGLRRTPGFTAAAVVILGVGLGLNLAVFTVANATLFKGFRNIPEQDRLVYITTARDCCISFLDLEDWRAATTIAGIEAVADLRVAIDTSYVVRTATATEVTFGLFALLRVRPALGRDFARADDLPGAPGVAIISDRFWRSDFRADAAVLGRVVQVNGVPTTIIGVMPPDFAFPQHQDLWLPIGPRVAGQPRNARGLWFGVGRLADGVTVQQARAELQAVGARMAATYPSTNAGVQPIVQTFRDLFVGSNALAIYGALWLGVGLLLVIAGANLVNLLVVRAAARTREVGVRLALGAGTQRVARHYLFESMTLSIVGGAIAWWLGALMVRGYAAFAVPPTQPWAAQLIDYSRDLRVLVYLIVASTATGVSTGLLPALRMSSLDIPSVLRAGGRGTVGSPAHHRIVTSIVVAQVALAVVLLSAAGLLARSFWNVHARDLGYDPSRVVVALSSLPATTYPDAATQFRFLDRLESSVRDIPGVNTVAFVDSLGAQGGGRIGIEIEGRPVTLSDGRPQVRQSSISANYFGSLGTSIVSGRDFDSRDTNDRAPVVVINERFADTFWGTRDVVGRRIRTVTGNAGAWLEVVGVAPNLHHGDRSRRDIEPAIYRPLRQRPTRSVWTLIRTESSPRLLLEPVRRQIQQADPNVPVWLGPFTLQEWNASSYWRRGINGGLFLVFAILALIVAGIGLFAVLSTAVAARRPELSVRMALGASPSKVLLIVVRQGLWPAAVGLALGIGMSLGTNGLVTAQLVEVHRWDPITLLVVTTLTAVSTLIGCFVPAFRAIRVDPVNAIRGE